jgi:hypothetical protein
MTTECCERCRPTGYIRQETADPPGWWYACCCAGLDEQGEQREGWFSPAGRLGAERVAEELDIKYEDLEGLR